MMRWNLNWKKIKQYEMYRYGSRLVYLKRLEKYLCLQLKFKKGDIITITQKEDGEYKLEIKKCTLQNLSHHVCNLMNVYVWF